MKKKSKILNQHLGNDEIPETNTQKKPSVDYPGLDRDLAVWQLMKASRPPPPEPASVDWQSLSAGVSQIIDLQDLEPETKNSATWLGPAIWAAVTAAVFFFGMLIGSKFKGEPLSFPTPVVTHADSPTPRFDRFVFHTNEGQVAFHYRTSDQVWQDLIREILNQPQRAGLRLQLVKTIGALPAPALEQGRFLQLMQDLMNRETNAGLRLQMSQTLARFPYSDQKLALMKYILQNDPNPAIRHQAMRNILADPIDPSQLRIISDLLNPESFETYLLRDHLQKLRAQRKI